MNDVVTTTEDGKALTDKQDAFAVAYATNGGNAHKAAVEAGYSEVSARTLGPRLLRNPLILKRIAEETLQVMATNVPKALGAQARLLTNARSDMVKHLVAQDMLDRVLGKATQRVQTQLDGELKVSIDLG